MNARNSGSREHDEDTSPSLDELLAMAYVDDELTAEARAQVDQRMEDEPALALAVARYRRLEVLARQVAPPEPMDHEWRRLRRDPVHRAGHGIGWVLLALGAVALAGWCLFELVRADLELVPKLACLGVVAGVLLLFLATLRARLRTLPFDPYVEVER